MRKRELYDEVERLRKINTVLYKDRDNLYKKLVDQNEWIEKKDRKEILKDYDVAILVKGHKTYLLQNGEEEKTISNFSLSQNAGSYPVLEIEKTLY